MTQGQATMLMLAVLLIARAVVYRYEDNIEASRALSASGFGFAAAAALWVMAEFLLEHLSIGWH